MYLLLIKNCFHLNNLGFQHRWNHYLIYIAVVIINRRMMMQTWLSKNHSWSVAEAIGIYNTNIFFSIRRWVSWCLWLGNHYSVLRLLAKPCICDFLFSYTWDNIILHFATLQTSRVYNASVCYTLDLGLFSLAHLSYVLWMIHA